MKNGFIIITLLCLFSCTRSDISKKLAGCDSLVITFNVPDTDSVINSVSTTDTKAIQKLARFLNEKPSDMKGCGFDGNMLFYKAGTQVMPVVFKYSKTNCRLFTYDLDNKVMKTGMSNEAADFLQSLAENRNWY